MAAAGDGEGYSVLDNREAVNVKKKVDTGVRRWWRGGGGDREAREEARATEMREEGS